MHLILVERCFDVFIFMVLYSSSAVFNGEMPRPKVTKFISGDDLEDDFLNNETLNGDKDKSSGSKVGSASESTESHVKPKKKQGPKVVNFVG